MNVSCALDPRSFSPLWCLSTYRSWAAQTSSSSTRALRSVALTTSKTATPRDARGIRGIFFVFQQDNAPAHWHPTLCDFSSHAGVHSTGSLDIANSSDLNPVNYEIWSVVQQRVYQSWVHDTDELKECVQQVWRDVDRASFVAQASSSCMRAGERRTLRAYAVENNTPISSQLYDNINVSFLSNKTRFLIFFCCNLQ